jgi:transcriptional regulator
MPDSTANDPEVVRLIDEHPLAWIVSQGAAGFGTTLLPLLAEQDASGRIVSLLGHFAVANRHVALLQAQPRAAILFLGPNIYVSPEYVSKPGWGPTWNYASASFDVTVDFLPDGIHDALRRLVDKMERRRREPWTIDKMGARYAQLAQRVIAFRAQVRSCTARFKLGQDETDQTLSEMLDRLPDAALTTWMRRHNANR